MPNLTAFVDLFRFIARARARRAAERAAERAHQLQLVDALFTKLVDLSSANNAGVMKLAEAQTAQAEVMAQWLKGFAISDPSPTPPQIVRDEDQWEQEQQRALREMSGELPPEFALALQLHEQENAGFDREGSDF